jgi:hypothetical protein
MSLVDRVKNILVSPSTEWEVISKEPATVGGLMTGYVIPLAGIAAIVSIITGVLFGAMLGSILGAAAAALTSGAVIIGGIINFVMGLLLVAGMGFVVSAIAPSFGGQGDPAQGLKLIAYAGTPVWIANFVPIVGSLLALIGLVYACYLIVIGSKPVLGVPEEKKASMGVVTLLIYFVGAIVTYLIGRSISGIFAGAAVASATAM